MIGLLNIFFNAIRSVVQAWIELGREIKHGEQNLPQL